MGRVDQSSGDIRPLRRRPRHGFNGNGGDRGAVVQVDVVHGVVGIVVALAVDVVVFHEEDDGDAGVGEDLAIGVEEGAAAAVGEADFAGKLRVRRHGGDGLAVGAALAPRQTATGGPV